MKNALWGFLVGVVLAAICFNYFCDEAWAALQTCQQQINATDI